MEADHQPLCSSGGGASLDGALEESFEGRRQGQDDKSTITKPIRFVMSFASWSLVQLHVGAHSQPERQSGTV
jgi:hypothetical protein